MIEIDFGKKNFNIKTKQNPDLIKKILKQIDETKYDKKIVKINIHSLVQHNIKNLEKMKDIEIIEIGNKINEPIYFSNISKNVKEIIIGKIFNSDLILPNSIENIEFCYNSKFNQPVNNLPEKLKYLKFGFNFNQHVDNLPNKLEYLYFGFNFNQELNFLPESIITLEFCYNSCFSKSLENLPNNIKKLLLNSKYHNNSIKLNNFSNNINFLRIPDLTNIHKFPTQINKLILCNDFNFDNLPNIQNFENIIELEINNLNPNDKIIKTLSKNNLQNIKKIIITLYHYNYIENFESKLNIIKHIYFINVNSLEDKTIFILENKL